ncbi:uncharacterized protein CMU_042600 [Cryptosporidium muris RN66]|uniref:Uncharacterized protein n=1 Tax=Cryptosporidium muris (strain RN66) TaxID=441375 RepID=B6AAE5_CRYMR|nr:uncharacterized protein CMU_042600 [Cryptosporidium muris RN66]EEA05186.1 hypothetical protein, conserved [Cryptosporidium muris RN66]|eukprot:XP_002139535.1 hypothetical protein [Cryptosporidium muris RN66]
MTGRNLVIFYIITLYLNLISKILCKPIKYSICGKWETKERRGGLSNKDDINISGCQWIGCHRIHIRESRKYAITPRNIVEFTRYEYNSTTGCEPENFRRLIMANGIWEVKDESKSKIKIIWKKIIIRTKPNNINILDDIKKTNWKYKSIDPEYFLNLNLLNTCIKYAGLANNYFFESYNSSTITVNGQTIKVSNEPMIIDNIEQSKAEEALLRNLTGYSGNIITDKLPQEDTLEDKWAFFFRYAEPWTKNVCKWEEIREFCSNFPVEDNNKCITYELEHIINNTSSSLKLPLYPFKPEMANTDMIEFYRFRKCKEKENDIIYQDK